VNVSGKPAKTREVGVDQTVVVVEFENSQKAIAAERATSTRRP
jgi:hypothetical protein